MLTAYLIGAGIYLVLGFFLSGLFDITLTLEKTITIIVYAVIWPLLSVSLIGYIVSIIFNKNTT